MLKNFSLIHKLRNKIRTKGNPKINIAKSAKIVGCKIYIKGKNNQLIIEENVRLRKTHINIIGDNCALIIKKNSSIGHGCYFSIKEGTKIIINQNCSLSRNAKLMTTDGHPIFLNNKRINPSKDIILHEHVWLGDNVTILKGVEVGKNSVVGINSTLTKSIPPGSIAAGNPARVIKEGITWKERF